MAEEPQDNAGALNDGGTSSMPKDAQVMASILKDMGVTDYEPRVINQLLEFTYRYITDVLDDAKLYSAHAGNSGITKGDVKFAIQTRTDHTFTSPPPRDFLVDLAQQKNQTALPTLKTYTGARLPPDRYCLSSMNFRLKSQIKPQHKKMHRPIHTLAPSNGSISQVQTSYRSVVNPQMVMPGKRKWEEINDEDDYDT